jgi:squalene-hopene/tetraprenyl-beta-curcumene cyclase
LPLGIFVLVLDNRRPRRVFLWQELDTIGECGCRWVRVGEKVEREDFGERVVGPLLGLADITRSENGARFSMAPRPRRSPVNLRLKTKRGVERMKSSRLFDRRFWQGLAATGVLATAVGLVGQHAGTAWGVAQESKPVLTEARVTQEERQAMIDRAIAFLGESQAEDGSFSSQGGPGVTGLVTASLLSVGAPVDHPVVAKGLAYIQATRREDGGLYAVGSRHSNYETCLAMMALYRANTDGRYDSVIEAAQSYVKTAQWDEGEGLKPSDMAFGGAGYGSKSRPDLSNTSFFIDALRSTGVPEEDPAIARALAFVNRCQNLESPANDTPFAGLVNDGGFYYTPANGGESMAGKDESTGGLRSYASMTYAGLKSMIYAGVDKSDYRVRAAQKFLASNYTVTSNPGMGAAGLYYYLQTMSKALSLLGESTFVSDQGEHEWKQDVLRQLRETQKENGSWTNPEARWMEGDPNLVTGYALLTIAYTN